MAGIKSPTLRPRASSTQPQTIHGIPTSVFSRPAVFHTGVNRFKGRTISVVTDLSVDEQIYLYTATRQLKEAVRDQLDLTSFQLADPDATVYNIFMENSTRTKESFRNAGAFHGVKVNGFDATTSSFQKNETITDTIKMLVGYSTGPSVFVIRSKLEGVCRWLETIMPHHAQRMQLPQPAFINAGDGRHEHPSQEFLDEFSFLEQLKWERKEIHIALVGDLYHGRTVHSKADGLRIFEKVTVDCVAPAELQMPKSYLRVMEKNGFTVRIFGSLDEYLAQASVAKIWYFTRLQVERMGDQLTSRVDSLRETVSMRASLMPLLPPGVRFYHPLPRDAQAPTLPFWLDDSEYNMWDRQAANGYYVRIMLFALLFGLNPGGVDERSAHGVQQRIEGAGSADFVEELQTDQEKHRMQEAPEVGIRPIPNGILIDHIGRGSAIGQIWDQLDLVRKAMEFDVLGASGVYASKSIVGQHKGIISMPHYAQELDRKQLKKLAALAPGCTVNIIKDKTVVTKFRLHMPPRIYNFPNIQCKNPNCVSHPDAMQREVEPHFVRIARGKPAAWPEHEDTEFKCYYCDRPHNYQDIWAVGR